MMNPKIVFLIITQLVVAINGFSQTRGGNPKFSADLNPYDKIIQDTATGKRTAKFIVNFKQPEVLRDYFTSSPCAEYTELSDTRIAQFNQFVEQFLSGRTDPKQMAKAENDFKKKGVADQEALIDYHINFIEKQGTFTTDAQAPIENLVCKAKGSIQAIKSTVAYLEAIKKIFPSLEGLNEPIHKGKEVLAAYPDNKAIISIIKKNRNSSK